MKIKSISKHVLAIVLSLAVLASTLMLNTFSAFAEATPALDIWDNTLAVPNEETGHPYTSGTGTELDPYIISTPQQLAYLVATIPTSGNILNLTNNYFKLDRDIYLNNVESPTWYSDPGNKNEWYSKDQNNVDFNIFSSFRGTLDGDGHTIYGLYFDRDATRRNDRWLGLFPILRGTIKNLRIADSYISTKEANNNVTVGAFAACVRGTTAKIINCAVEDTTVRGYMVGGFVGSFNEAGTGAQNTKLVIDGCYSKAEVITTFNSTAEQLNRMFVGECRQAVGNNKNHTVEIRNSYAEGDLDFAPPAVDAENGDFVTTITNCYTTKADSTEAGVTVRTLAQMTGAKARVYMNTFDFKNVWYTEAGKTPQLRFGKNENEKPNATKLWKVWNGEVPETVTFDGGNGNSAATAYEISTAEQLAYIVKNGGDKYYKLTDDIYLNDVSKPNWKDTAHEWVGTDRKLFSSNLDGNGHTVYGLYLSAETQDEFKGYCGLFPCLVRGNIKNLRISMSYVESVKYDGAYGVLVGMAWNGSKIESCVIDETVEFITGGYGSPLIGAVAGDAKSPATVENCYVAAKMSGTHGETKPAAFLGKPLKAAAINYTQTSHLIVNNSYYSGEFDLAAEVADAPVIYQGCYTTKVYDAEKGEKAPTGVTAVSNLEAMKTNGLTAVLNVFPMLGNVNDDANAVVDICDLVILKKFALGMGVNIDIYSSDVNNDREINGMDFAALQKYILTDASVFQ